MGGQSTNTVETAVSGIDIQTSLLGQPIAIGWGRGKQSCNLIEYVDFTAIGKTTTSGGKGGSASSTSYTYTASVIMALCEGPIRGIRKVYKDSSVFTDGATTALAQAGLSLMVGNRGQAAPAFMSSLHPDRALGYSELAYVYAQNYGLGSSATLANHSFEIDYAIQSTHAANGDAEPVAIVTDFLTNAGYGVTGWASGLLGDWTDINNYTIAAGLFLSPVLNGSVSGADFLRRIALQTNSEFFWSEGVLKWKSYGDAAITGNGVTWTPDLTPLYGLTEDEFLEEVHQEIIDQTDAYNYVQIEYLDRSNQYNTAVQPAQDLDNILQFGLRKKDVETMHDICEATVAAQVAQLYLQRTLYIRDRFHFTLPEDFVGLEVMDYVSLTTVVDGIQLTNQLVLIEQIDEQDDGSLQFVAKGIPQAVGSTPTYTAHTSSGTQPAVDVDPGYVNNPVIFQAPTGLTTTGNEVWIAASGGAHWGGCYVWLSYDGASYTQVGTITGKARYGTTTAALASGSDPDTTHTLSVDLSASMGTLGSVTQAEADALASLCYIDGEVIAYRDAALTSAYHYDLTYLRRGKAGTAAAAHASGRQFVRLDEALFRYAHQSADIGRTVYIKLQSYNVYGRGVQDLADLDPYSYTVNPAVAVPDNLAATTTSQMIAASREAGITITGAASGGITISAHQRVYSDKTVGVNSGSLSGFSVGQTVYLYYDDPLRAGGAVGYASTTTAANAKASTANPYRHFVGQVTIPASGTASGYPEYSGDINATYGAPSGTPVGSTTADSVANTVTNTVPAISSALATAQSQITTVQGDVAAAAATANSAASTASAAASGLAAEISRATGAEGTLSSQIYSLGTSVSGLSSSLSSEAIARANGDSALAGQITTVQAFATPNPNLLSNPTGALGLQGWTKAYAATLTTYFGIYGEGNYFYGTATSAAGGLGYYQDIPCQSGVALSISADIFAGGLSIISGAVAQARVYIEWLNSSGGHLGYSIVAPVPAGTGWTHTSASNQVSPAGTATARVWMDIWGDGAWSSTNTGWKRIKVEQGTACTAYSDDTTPGTLGAQITTETAARISAVSAVASSVTSLTATVNSNTAAISANYTALSNTDASLAASITTLNSNYGSLSSTVSSNYTTLSNGISTNASAISSLNSSYGSLSSTVTTQASAIADLQGRTGAYWSVTAVSGGGRASITLFSTTSYSGFDIVGDVRINGSLLVTGSVTADRVVANGITEVLQAYNGSSYSGPNLVDTGTTDPTTGDPIYAVDYWDVISLTVTMAYSGDIVALVAAKQWYYSGGRDWAAQITVDGTEVFYTEGGTGAISDSIALSGKLSVSAGTHTVKFRWRSSDSTLAMLAGKASLVTIRRYV